MKIAIVSQYYKPEAVPIPEQLAAGLVDRGHQVRVITGYPNYPAGRLFRGYRQRLVHTEFDGEVRVRRVPIVVSHSRSMTGRILSYLSFGLSALTAGRFVRDADVIYVYATPMTAAIAPSIWRHTRRIPFVMHVQDVWPESITGSTMLPRGRIASGITVILKPWLRYLYQAAAATIAIAPTMKDTLVSRGVPDARCHMVFNWGNEPDRSSSRECADSAFVSKGCTVSYAGNVGDLQDLETVVRAANAVRDLADFRLVIRGEGVALPRLRTLADELGATNVHFKEQLGVDRLGRLYQESDFQMVPLKDLPIFRGTIPSKFQASLAHGVPVITTVTGDVASIVLENQVGFTALPEHVESLEAAFRQAYSLTAADRIAMAQRARGLYESTMSSSRGLDQIEQILLSVSARESKEGTDVIAVRG